MNTQNDWEDILKDYLFLTNIRWAFIHEKMKIGMVTADQKREYLLAIDGLKNLLADARKEERMKAEVETGLKNFKVTMEEISKARKEVIEKIEKEYEDCDGEAITYRDWKKLLATLKEVGV